MAPVKAHQNLAFWTTSSIIKEHPVIKFVTKLRWLTSLDQSICLQAMISNNRNWLFLLYLVLLVNLGPYHHANFFGFHSEPSAQSCCSCCHHCGTSDSTEIYFESAHDCSLCDFFQHFNSITADCFEFESSDPVSSGRELLLKESFRECFSVSPRGPPAYLTALSLQIVDSRV